MGAYIYAIAVPEKWKPGRFDVLWSSHNIFHILVVMGAYMHYRAALVLMVWCTPVPSYCSRPHSPPLSHSVPVHTGDHLIHHPIHYHLIHHANHHFLTQRA